MSDTPRTDAQVKGDPCSGYPILTGNLLRDAFIPSDFARQLERENNSLRHALKTALAIESLDDANLEELIARCRCIMREQAVIDAATKETAVTSDRAAELHRLIYCCPPCTENAYEGFTWRDAHEELETDLAVANKIIAHLINLNSILTAALSDISVACTTWQGDSATKALQQIEQLKADFNSTDPSHNSK